MRYFNPVTKTEALEGVHDLTGCLALPDNYWFFILTEIPEGKAIDVSDEGAPVMVDTEQPAG